jgi:thymidylate kinase
MFLVIEGIDGAGKGRQRNEITALLKPKFKKLHSLEFPDHQGILYKELIKPALLEKISLSPAAMFISFCLDQLLYQEKVKAARGSKSEYMLCDGYFTTNLAYNVYVNKMFTARQALGFAADFGLAPADLNIFIDVTPETAWQRKKLEPGHEQGLDINERDLAKQAKIRKAYLTMAKQGIFGPWEVVDGNGSIAEVTANIMKVLIKTKFI